MVVATKVRSKMVSDTVTANIQLMRLLIKDSGSRVRNKVRERLSSKVGVFSRDSSKMIWSITMGRCTTILQGTIFKDNGVKMSNVVWGLWIGLISGKSIWDIGKIINKKDGESMYGLNQRDKASLWGIGMKVIGKQVSEVDLVSFTMLMDHGIRATGKTIWKKATLSTQTKMEKLLSFYSAKTVWSKAMSLTPLTLKTQKKSPTKKKYSPIYTL